MRRTGETESTRGFGAHDHLCWAYEDHEEFRTAAIAFLQEGLLRGERIAYIGEASTDDLRRDLGELEPVGDLLAAGALELTSLSEQYRAATAGSPAEQAAAYQAATERALADGYTGLRVAAEATPLVARPEDRATFLRYEHLVDRLMANGLPFTALCGYDRRRLDKEAVDDLASIHPVAHGSSAAFHVFATPTADLALAGEVDTVTADGFARALERVLVNDEPGGPHEIVVDCNGLAFADHRALVTLDNRAAAAGVDVVLVSAPRMVARLHEILDFRRVRVVAS